MSTSHDDAGVTLRFGVDIGGTFTDLVAVRSDGAVYVEKVLSSVDDYSRSIGVGIATILKRAGVAANAVREVIHGTTVATNAILEQKGARTGLLTTAGFRDILDIRRCRRPDMYRLDWSKPPVLVPRHLRQEVVERIDSHGRVVRALDVDSARKAIARLAAGGIESVAVCLINAYANAEHERVLARLLEEELPGVSVSLSCDVLPEAKEYERTSTTCINAYIRPVVARYIDRLSERLRELGIDAPLLTMQSSGGVMGARMAAERPIHIVESGPAAGVIGGLNLARGLGIDKAVTFDMGGTTAKASLIENGAIRRHNHLEVGAGMSTFSRLTTGGGYALSTPTVDVAEVGVGGGSIAWLDEGQTIRVGPQSAGAQPGPACYALGGEAPTVTDANLVLGYLNPDYLVGGALRLDAQRARRAVATHIAEPLGIGVEEAAFGIVAVANAGMTRVIRAISSERGRDPRTAALIAFGGNGPVHAADLARSLGMQRVIIPPTPGVFSAVGLLGTAIEHGYSRSCVHELHARSTAALDDALAQLRDAADKELASADYSSARVRWRAEADLQYRGQGSQLTLEASAPFTHEGIAALRSAFDGEHLRIFEYAVPEQPVDVVTLRLTAVIDRHAVPLVAGGASSAQPNARRRRAYFGPAYGSFDVPVLDRASVARAPVRGPAVIEQYDTTIVIPPGAHAACDASGNVVVELGADAVAVARQERFDPVTRELVRHSLEALTDEMALTVVRTCRSNHVKHTGDFSTAIADAQGRLLAQGLTVPLHLGALPDAMEAVLAGTGRDVSEGDVLVMNDPFNGGMHLPDVFVIKPVFHGGRVVAMTACIVHQVDIGGRVAGGNSTMNTEIYAEGLRLPLLKLYEGGTLNQAVMNIIRANVRVPDKVEGDIKAQLAACRRGEREYLALIERYSLPDLQRYQEQLLGASERAARDTIRAIPDGVYEFADYMDGDGYDPQPIPIRVRIEVKGDEATVDCAGSSPQVRGAINSTLSVTKSTAYLAFRCLMPAHASTNSGYMRPIRVLAEPGTILNGVLPAAGAGRAATAYRLMDAIFGALAQAVPDRIMAAGDGCSILHTFFGRDDAGKPFLFLDMMRGSWGAQPAANGLDGTSLALANASAIPLEIIELESPLRVERYGYVPDTEGAGRFRGGIAVVKDFRVLASCTLQYRSERRRYRPYGLAGGEPGSVSVVILDPDGERRLLPEKGEVQLVTGSVIRFMQSGGGGYGNPLERDPDDVARDVRDELLGIERACEKYGVVVDRTTLRVERDATTRLRAERGRTTPGEPAGVVEATDADVSAMLERSAALTSLH